MCNNVTKGNIKLAIETANFQEVKEEMQNSTKCGDRITDNPLDKSYLLYMPLPICRIWMRYRAMSIAGMKANTKSTYRRTGRTLDFRFCDSHSEESQEHLEICEGTEYERRGLNLTGWFRLLNFWRRMCRRLTTNTTAAVT